MDTCDKMDFHRTWYEYDVLGNLTEVTDAANNVTTMNYDALGRKINMTDPDMGYWTYGYDNAGNLISQTDLKGQDIRFFYDAINRLTEKRLIVEEQQSGLLLASYSYDNTVDFNKGIGRRTGMVAYDPPGVVNNSASWKYDSLGRVIQENRVVASNIYRFDFGYTQGDLPVTVRYPGGTAGQQGEIVTTNYYWITGQPKTLVGTSTYVYDAQYNMPTGQTTQLNLAGPAIYTNYNYDANFRLQSLATIANGNTQLSYRYTYDPVGNVTEIKDLTPPNGVGKTAPSQIQAFKYDSLNRLVHAQATGDGSGLYNETYAYDAIGNLINKAGQVMGYGTGTAGPHAVTTVNGVQQYWYDDNGNMTQRPDGNGGTHELYWTAENMLSTVGGDSETAASFRYDADGMMVLRTEGADNGVSTVYLGKLYQHKLSVSNVVTKHYMFNGQLVAQREGASSVTFLLGDHLGSVTTVLWASGAVKDNQRYNPWGEVRWAQSGNPITGYSYTSQRYDDALGLYDYNARYYDPTIARFINADTIVPDSQVPQSFNRYSYTVNNPLRYVDPTGHQNEPVLDGSNIPRLAAYAGLSLLILLNMPVIREQMAEAGRAIGEAITDITFAGKNSGQRPVIRNMGVDHRTLPKLKDVMSTSTNSQQPNIDPGGDKYSKFIKGACENSKTQCTLALVVVSVYVAIRTLKPFSESPESDNNSLNSLDKALIAVPQDKLQDQSLQSVSVAKPKKLESVEQGMSPTTSETNSPVNPRLPTRPYVPVRGF